MEDAKKAAQELLDKGKIQKEHLQDVADILKATTSSYKEQVDLSKQLVDQLKKIEGMYKNNEISFSKMSDISKRVLSDTKARGLIQNQMSSDIEDSQKEIIKKRLAGLAEETAAMEKIIELKKEQDK